MDIRPYCLYDGGESDDRCQTNSTRMVLLEVAPLVVILPQGGGGKYTWVLFGEALEMLSRIAESLFWLAQYIEEGGNACPHSGNVNFHTVLEQSKGYIPALGSADHRNGGRRGRFPENRAAEADAQAVFEFLAFRHDQSQLDRAVRHESARKRPDKGIRDYISREMWEDINSSVFHREPVS